MSTQPIRIALNGFGRIGRTLLRILMQDAPQFELVLINEIEPLETCAYLFQYDSVFGPWPGSVSTQNQALIVDGIAIPFLAQPDLRSLDLSGVDVVLECTGMGGTRGREPVATTTARHDVTGLETFRPLLLTTAENIGAEAQNWQSPT